jgi:FtsH-binding integral membrane protein
MTNSTFTNATAHHQEMDENIIEKTSVYFYLTFIVMCLFFFVSSSLIEKYKPLYGHETGYTILVGVTISLLIYAIVGHDVASSFKF